MPFPPAADTVVDPLAPAAASAAPVTDPNEDARQAALIAQYESDLKVPSKLSKWFKAFQKDRDYVNDECMLLDAEDAVGTNHILRNQYLLTATIAARDPQIVWRPGDQIYPDQPPSIDPMTGMISGPKPGEAPKYLTDFGRTLTIVVKDTLRKNRFRQRLRGAVQDIETNNLVWIKVNQQMDVKRDPIGNFRVNDQQNTFALYRYYQEQVTNGDIGPDSAEMAKYLQLTETVRTYLTAELQQQIQMAPMAPQIDPMTGLSVAPPDPRQMQMDALKAGTGQPIPSALAPNVPFFVGFTTDFLLPDDVRIDWRITRPEDVYDARQIMHRVRMTRKEVVTKFKLTPEQAKLIPTFQKEAKDTNGSNVDHDYAARQTLEDAQTGDETSVWEVWDRETNRVNVFIPGYKKFLDSYTPTAVWRHWFPFIPALFNRTTGRFVGISSTALQRPAQEEINLFRTHDRHAKKAAFPRILVKKGAFRKGEKMKYQNSRPYQVIELESVDEVRKAIYETQPVAYNGQLYDTSRAEMDLQKMAGVSTVAGGVTGASDSATEVVTAQQGVDKLADFKSGVLDDVILDVGTCIADISLQIMPLNNIMAIAGPGAVWPVVDKETIYGMLHLEVTAGSMGAPDTQKRLGFWKEMFGLATACGMRPKGPEIMDVVARDTGIYEGLSRYFEAAPMGMEPGAPGGDTSAGPAKGPTGPNSQQGQGGGNPGPEAKRPLGPENISGPKPGRP